MKNIQIYLQQAQSTLCKKVEIAGLYARNPIAHKWKVTFRCLAIRELVSWRFFDLLIQAVELQKLKHILGARILLRSGIETLSLLIYINQKMENLVETGNGFNEFSEMTSKLLLGSKNNVTSLTSINIITILEKCDKRYPGIMKIYADLSESAHPNWESVMLGYSKTDYDNFEINFENCWEENYGSSIKGFLDLFLQVFESEYNDLWVKNFEKFEKWIELNDKKLEKPKPS